MSNSLIGNTVNRNVLRLSAVVLFLGEIIIGIAGSLHPAHEPANNHAAVFAEYAASANWTMVHLGQFVGMLVVIAGLLILFNALNVRDGLPGLLAQGGAVAAILTLGLYGVLQAIDGVALKQVVDAWAKAPEAEKAARFASAEAIRFLEWGGRSYQDFMLGLTFILFAVVIMWTAKTPRLIGLLMGLSGLAYLKQGLVTGSEGFSLNNSSATLIAYAFWLVWSVWLLIFAWRMTASN